MPRRGDPAEKAPVRCWFCGRAIPITRVIRHGIILTREESRGGPQRLLICPSCLKENLCEETRKGRWFASPRVSLGLLDILFSQLPGAATEEVLQAISWYRENEERRRFFFESDGDPMYQRKARDFLRKLWPWWTEPDREEGTRKAHRRPAGKAAGEGTRPGGGAARGPGGGSRRGPAGDPGGARDPGDARRRREPPPPGRPRVVTPQEVLGVGPGAAPEEIRRAFHRLAVRYHPDKVHHLGEEFQAMAHLKFLELKRAYEALMGR